MMTFLAVLFCLYPNTTASQSLKFLYAFPVSHGVVHISWESDGKQLVVGSSSGVLITWDVQTRQKIREVKMEREITKHPIRGYIFTTKGRVFVWIQGGTIALCSAQTGKTLRTFNFGEDKRWVNRVMPIGHDRCLVVIIDEKKGKREFVEIDPDKGAFPSQRRAEPFIICPHGDREIWRMNSPEQIVLVEARTQNPLLTLDFDMEITDVALSDDCRRLAVLSSRARTIWVYESATGKEVAKIGADPETGMDPYTDAPVRLWLSPKGHYLAVARGGIRVEFFSLATGKRIAVTGAGCQFSDPEIAFSPDERFVAVAGSHLWGCSGVDAGVCVYKIP